MQFALEFANKTHLNPLDIRFRAIKEELKQTM